MASGKCKEMEEDMGGRLKIFTWHIHGSYLYYLSKGDYDIYLPVDDSGKEGYKGRGTVPFGDNVHEVTATQVRHLQFDCILFQSGRNYLIDQHILFSPEQHALPKIYLEYSQPKTHPTDTLHMVDDPYVVLVHVTHFNNLMWNNNQTSTAVIEHGVTDPGVHYSGSLEKGIVLMNNIGKHDRRFGLDILNKVRHQIPLDIVGVGSQSIGGIGEVPFANLGEFLSRYRFFFTPVRYGTLGLSVCQAMMLGMPVLGTATNDLPLVIRNGESGYLHNDINALIRAMKMLLADRSLAAAWGENARKVALERFNISRFNQQWRDLFSYVVSREYPYRNALVVS